MSVPEHTPGPWHLIQGHACTGTVFIGADTEEGRAEIAAVYAHAEYAEELPADANARLIAAAPAMLEALELAVIAIEEEVAEFGECDEFITVLPILKSRIAAAKGESQ